MNEELKTFLMKLARQLTLEGDNLATKAEQKHEQGLDTTDIRTTARVMVALSTVILKSIP
jgi:hypothetical protein